MRIPNKFNGYSADNRRLYHDPATLAALAAASEAAAAGTAATAATAAAAPTLAAAAAPALTTAATTAGAELGTTAALEASKQGIMQAGADVMAQEAAKQAGQQVVQEGVKQAGQEAVKEGIMSGAQTAAPAGAPAPELPANAFPGDLWAPPPAAPPAPPVAPPTAPPAPYDLLSKGVNPDIATKSIDQIASTSLPQSSLPSTNIADGANVAKDVVGNPNLKVGAEQLATKTPPNALERGFSAAKEFAGDVSKFSKEHPLLTTGGIMLAQNLMQPSYDQPAKKDYRNKQGNTFSYTAPSTGTYTPIYKPTAYAVGGPVEQMSAQNAIGNNQMYPQSQLQTSMYSNPMVQRPMPNNVVHSGIDAPTNSYTGEARFAEGGIQGYADGGKLSTFEKWMKEEKARQEAQAEAAQAQIEKGKSLNPASKPYSRTQSTNSPYSASVKELQAMGKKYGIPVAAPAKTTGDLMGDQDQMEYAANGGIMHGLGGYSDGGRLLKGPGDGVSDSIPAVIGNKQPARLADGEFVIPARIVSELGNGSTEAGARKLYAMMERVQKQRGKTTGKGKVAVNSKADKHLPA